MGNRAHAHTECILILNTGMCMSLLSFSIASTHLKFPIIAIFSHIFPECCCGYTQMEERQSEVKGVNILFPFLSVFL